MRQKGTFERYAATNGYEKRKTPKQLLNRSLFENRTRWLFYLGSRFSTQNLCGQKSLRSKVLRRQGLLYKKTKKCSPACKGGFSAMRRNIIGRRTPACKGDKRRGYSRAADKLPRTTYQPLNGVWLKLRKLFFAYIAALIAESASAAEISPLLSKSQSAILSAGSSARPIAWRRIMSASDTVRTPSASASPIAP